jgi:hypothetical protein
MVKMIPAQTYQWTISGQALNGTGKFLDKSCLVRFPRETIERYQQRCQLAFYRNFMREKCSRFAGYLSIKPVLREVSHPLLIEILDDVDLKGNSISVFMTSLALEVKARGTMIVIVDMQADPTQGRKTPYFIAMQPESIVDYALNVNKRLSSISFRTMEVVGDKQQQVTRTYTDKGWHVVNGQQIIASGEHNLGICPVVAITEHGDFPCVGEFYQIAELSTAIMNKESEKNDILRNQTFSILTYQLPLADTSMDRDAIDADTAAAVESLGTSNMLTYQAERPAFIAPDASPADTIEKHIQRLAADIDRIGYTVSESNNGTESGLSRKYRFQDLNSALSRFARRLEDAERQLLDLSCKWLGITPDFTISYANDFNLTDIDGDIATAQAMQTLGAPAEYLREKLKHIIRADLVGSDIEEIDKIIAAIDNQAFVAPIL